MLSQLDNTMATSVSKEAHHSYNLHLLYFYECINQEVKASFYLIWQLFKKYYLS